MENITLDRTAQQRLSALTQLLSGSITTAEAANALGLSVRQIERLRSRFRERGAAALVHGNSGRRPANRVSEEERQQIVYLARGKYEGFNFEHFTEMLAEDEGIHVSADTVRRTCLAAGVTPPKQQRRRPKRRDRREPCAQEGELLQLDGSIHDWLEGRGPKLVLINAIDDATKWKWGRFFEAETLEGYAEVLSIVIRERGVPLAAYHDGLSSVRQGRRFSKAVSDHTKAQLRRAYEELGVVCIIAGSPQAKGRVERTHGTDQDRLCSLLRLHHACTLEQANAVLQLHLRQVNRKFTRPAANPTPAWQPRPRTHLADVFCIKEDRVVSGDNTVKVYGRLIDIPAGSPRRNYAGCRVQIHRRFDTTIGVFFDGRRIAGTPPRSTRRPTKSLRS